MHIVSWKGHEFADDNLENGIPFDLGRDQWAPVVSTIDRPGNTSVIADVSFTERAITATFKLAYGFSTPFLTWLNTLTMRLNPIDTEPGTLVIEMPDTTLWSCQAVVTRPSGYTRDADVDLVSVTWLTTDPLWHAANVETVASVVEETLIPNSSFGSGSTGWTASANPANVTGSFSTDTGVYYDAPDAGKFTVTANTGAGGTVYVLNDVEYPCGEGDIVSIKCAVRATNGQLLDGNGVDARPYIGFYNAADALIGSSSGNWVSGLSDNVWEPGSVATGTAPALTDYCKIGAQVLIGAGDTGTAYFDYFQFVSGITTSTPFEVGGNAPTYLTVTATPAGDFPQAIYARTFTITNDGDKTLFNHPYRVNLGNGSTNLTSGTYWALLRDGKPQPCQITDYDAAQAFMWMVIDHLAPGASADYTLLVSDQTILPNTTFNRFQTPAFDIGSAYVTTTVGSTATVTQIPTGLGSEIDRWNGGIMYVLSGAQAGTSTFVTDSSTTTVTHGSLAGGALASGVSVAIFMSSNTYWIYPVRKTERSDVQRGLWALSSGQKKPSDYRYDVPGAWAPYLYYDNSDEFVQKWNTAFDAGGGDADYVSILDTRRTWERPGQQDRYLDEGGHDGVAIFLPVKITGAKFDYQWRNPNSMAIFVAGSRQENGAQAFTHEYEDDDAYSTLTNIAIQTLSLEADTYGFYLGVIPNGTDVIGTTWAGDEGSATSGTATQLNDSSKEWISDQFIGGSIKIVSGTSAGSNEAITDNGPNSITVASWSNGTPDDTSRYRIINKDHEALARNHTYMHLALDQSAITASSVSAETPAFVLYRDLIINDVDSLGDEAEVQRISINPETTGRYIVLLADESFVVDGETMQGWVADSTSGDYIRAVAPQAFSVLDVDGDDRRAALHWLRVNPGEHSVTLASDEAGVAVEIDVEWREAQYA